MQPQKDIVSHWSPNQSRPLLWSKTRLLRLARDNAAQGLRLSDIVVQEAIKLSPDEALTGVLNTHFLRAGTRRTLAEATAANDIFIEVGRLIGRTSDWLKQKKFIEFLFASYFGQSSDELGWVSFLTLRRPQPLRTWEDPKVRIVPALDRPQMHVSPKDYSLEAELRINDVEVDFADARFAFSQTRRQPKIRRVDFSKVVESPYPTKRLNEWWYAPITRNSDVEVLANRRIPALFDEGYYDHKESEGLGKSHLLNLVKLTSDGRAMDCTLEIQPQTGLILSIRGYDTSLPTLLVTASTVEERALIDALRELAYGASFKKGCIECE
jgi:hypothetical protein